MSSKPGRAVVDFTRKSDAVRAPVAPPMHSSVQEFAKAHEVGLGANPFTKVADLAVVEGPAAPLPRAPPAPAPVPAPAAPGGDDDYEAHVLRLMQLAQQRKEQKAD